MRKTKLICGIVSLIGAVAFAAEPTVTDVVAKQRYPWNGLVDITSKVEGIDEAKGDWHFVLLAIFPPLISIT